MDPGRVDPSNTPVVQSARSSHVWSGAIARLQTQVSLNTSMLESNRRQINDIEQSIGRLQKDVGSVVAVIHEVRAGVHARPVQPIQRHDSGDLELLATQVATIGSKANEIDGLKMQLELVKNRMRRLEEAGSPQARRAGTSSILSSNRELYEASSAPATHPQHQAQQLPPMRTAPVMSPPAERPHPMPIPPLLPSHGSALYSHAPEVRQLPGEQSRVDPPAPNYRYAEPTPAASAPSSWRSGELQASHTAAQPPPGHAPLRTHTVEAEAPGSGWASVNQPIKRSFEEQHRSPYDQLSSALSSPKRPKLAPIMPRGGNGEKGYAQSESSLQQPSSSAMQEWSLRSRSRGASDATRPHTLPTASSANAGAYRFVTSAVQLQAGQQTPWRSEPERVPGLPQPQHSAPGGTGRGGRGRGGRGRGDGDGAQAAPETQETELPEWEKLGWSGSQMSPNGYYNAMHAGRRGLPGAPSDRPEADDPATPARGEQDLFSPQPDVVLNSSAKKSRTKPIRNTEGILIRKDGRPDMRSVSSANNLRKAHAKKEAERAEQEGRTPNSARSIVPLHSNSLSEDDHEMRSGTPSSTAAHGDEENGHDTQERHRELMSRIFPQGIDGGGARGLAGAYFPHREYPQVMKIEEPEEVDHRIEATTTEGDTAMIDARAAERGASEQRKGSKAMAPFQEEAAERRAAERDQAQAQDQSAEQAATTES